MSPARPAAGHGPPRLGSGTRGLGSGVAALDSSSAAGLESSTLRPGSGGRGLVPAALGQPVWLVRAAVFLGLAVLLVVLAGCGSGSTSDQDPAPAAGGKSSSPTADGPGPEDSPDPGLSGSPTPTVPPGDPDSTESAEPHDDSDHEDEGEAREVPANAMLDAATVGAVAGGSWSEAAGVLGCGDDPAPGALGSRALGLTSSTGSLIEVVGAYADKASAKTAVAAAAEAIAPCGYSETGDPRIGDASLEMAGTGQTGPDRKAVLIAAEGVLVVLVADGSAVRPGTWESLADLALGTSCAAAAHGCH